MKGLFDKLGSRKLAVTAIAGAGVTAAGAELTWPMAAVAVAYVLGQAWVDAQKGTE